MPPQPTDQPLSRMWRNEVNMRKRERARQQAEELRKMQKLFLLKAMSSPGDLILLVTCRVILDLDPAETREDITISEKAPYAG